MGRRHLSFDPFDCANEGAHYDMFPCQDATMDATEVDVTINNEPELSPENISLTMNDLIANQCNVDPSLSSNRKNSAVRVLICYPNLDIAVKEDFTE